MAHGYWDIHNHILPGVDDGSSCMEETVHMLTEEYRQGVRNIIFTPHFRPGMFDIRAQDREMVYQKVCRAVKDSFPDMKLYLGCEYHVQDRMLRDLKDRRCRMAGTGAVLLEFSARSGWNYIKESIRSVRQAGYRPLTAHLERYECMYKDPVRLTAELKDMGAMVQLNAGSILGKSGRKTKKFCRTLLDHELADIIASDAHNMDMRPVQMEECLTFITHRYGAKMRDDLFAGNVLLLLSERQGGYETDS